MPIALCMVWLLFMLAQIFGLFAYTWVYGFFGVFIIFFKHVRENEMLGFLCWSLGRNFSMQWRVKRFVYRTWWFPICEFSLTMKFMWNVCVSYCWAGSLALLFMLVFTMTLKLKETFCDLQIYFYGLYFFCFFFLATVFCGLDKSATWMKLRLKVACC